MEDALQPGRVRYTPTVKVKDVQETSRQEFFELQLQWWGDPDFTACEYLEGHQPIQPFLDYDRHLEHEPTDQEKQEDLQRCRTAIIHMFRGDPDFSYEGNVLEASRHGLKPDGKWKISWRFVITDLCIIKMQDMPHLLRELEPPDDKNLFDLSVYSSKRVSLKIIRILSVDSSQA